MMMGHIYKYYLLLSFIVPSTTARAAMLLPICMMVLQVYKAVPGESNFGKQLMIQEIHFNNITTSGILTATAGQIMAVGYITDMTGLDVTWGDWLLASMPIAILTLVASFFIGELVFSLPVPQLVMHYVVASVTQWNKLLLLLSFCICVNSSHRFSSHYIFC